MAHQWKNQWKAVLRPKPEPPKPPKPNRRRQEEVRPGYRKTLAETPAVPVTAEHPIPGLGGDEYVIPRLWAIQDRMREMIGTEGNAEVDRLTAQFLGGDGPWRD
jgi:hypothetical protein